MFAVIKTGGKQYRVQEGMEIRIEKVAGNPGDAIAFDDVLCVSGPEGQDLSLGTPLVSGAKVSGTIVSQGLAKKVTVLKYKNKTRYRRKKGHRQAVTKVKIEKIAV